jgi:hypothetical protein
MVQILQVALVADEHFYDAIVCVPLDFAEPMLDIFERVLVCDVIYHNDSIGSPVV